MELRVMELDKSFGDVHALKGISFSAKSGSPFGLLGRNGAGKTTAMRIIMDIFKPDSGDVTIDGKPITASGAKIGYLPEERGLYRKMSVSEQLVYFGRLRGLSRGDANKAVNFWLDKMDLSEYKNKKVETLSKGNQQRIQLALTLLNDPDVVILDEPFSGLDPVNAIQLRKIVAEFASKDKIVIFSSHQMNVVEDFCDDLVILNRGEVVLSGSLVKLRGGYEKDRIRIVSEGGRAADAASGFGSVSDAREGFIVQLADESARGALLQAVVASGDDIVKFEVVEPTLEEIFVSVAGEYSEGGDEK